jgi:hypothetical protein
MSEPAISTLAAVIAAIADLASSLVWPVVLVAGVLYAARNPTAREYASNLISAITRRVERGDTLIAGPFTLQGTIPPEVASNRVQAATSEGAGGAGLTKAPLELVELLRQKQYGAVNDYPYLVHAAEMQRAPTTPASGRWTIRLWLEFDEDHDFTSRDVAAVYYRLHDSWRKEKRIVSTSAANKHFELWLSVYGEFKVVAAIELRDHRVIWLSRYLDLPGRPTDS